MRIVVALGGDGHMLETLHQHLGRSVAIYGMNCGTVGFLMNQYGEENLAERLAKAQAVTLKPLRMEALTVGGQTVAAIAFKLVDLTIGLRVPEEEEREGLDTTSHGEAAYRM
mgnify:CR=1 FL=1